MNRTDPAYEAERGRVPLWLHADVVRPLAKRCICGQPSYVDDDDGLVPRRIGLPPTMPPDRAAIPGE